MTTRNWKILFLINLGILLLVLSPFLPGPSNGLVHLFYNAGQMAALIGLVCLPFGLIWAILEWRLKWIDINYTVTIRSMLFLTLPLTLILFLFISYYARDFSRNFAISRTEDLVNSIEMFNKGNGRYPDSLAELTPEFIENIPSSWIMGIDGYYYAKQDDAFTISFYQNVIMSFNFEVVTYDPSDHHKTEGESMDLYETGKPHWKYYIYD